MSNVLKAHMPNEEDSDSFESVIETLSNQPKIDNSVVQGVIVDKSDAHLIVDVGAKAEGMVQRCEFTDGEFEKYGLGDVIDIYVVMSNANTGELILSYEKCITDRAMVKIEEDYKNGNEVEGKIISKSKKGFIVSMYGVNAFLPFNNFDAQNADPADLIDSVMTFQIAKIDMSSSTVILAKKFSGFTVGENADEDPSASIDFNVGDVITGTVCNIESYGAFIDLGNNIGGLLHISNMALSRGQPIKSLLTVGQSIDVKVLAINMQKKRISLGAKQVHSEAIESKISKYKVNDLIKGKVVFTTDYGAFVEIEPGIEGLVHISEFVWSKKRVNVGDYVKIGDEVEAVILSIECDKQYRIRLGFKQKTPDPAKVYFDKNQDEIIDVVVSHIGYTNVFVNINKDIKGIISVSEFHVVSKKNSKIVEGVYNGQKVRAKVCEYDPKTSYIKLSFSEVNSASFDALDFDVDAVLKCTVREITGYGLGVEIDGHPAVNAFIRIQELSKYRTDRRVDMFKIGEEIEAMVITIDKNVKRVLLSIKALQIKESEEALVKYDTTDNENIFSTIDIDS